MSNVTPVMGPCPNPKCGSSNANATYPDDGHSWCYSCETYTSGEKSMQQTKIVPINNPTTSTLRSVGVVSDIPERKIKKETAQKYNAQVMRTSNIITHHIYQYFDSDGNHIANKIRDVKGKKFWSEGNLTSSGLFGEHIFGGTGKYITVCEGEIDAMSAYEMLGSKWPVVSIKNGAASALQNCRDSFEYLNKFEQVVLCFDNDKPGREAALKVAELFDPNKCKIVQLELKDANEYLKTNQRKKFSDDWWNATTFTPAGIVNLADLGSTLYDEKYCETVEYPWQGLNEKTYGMRTGELVTFTSGAGMGKSSIIRELMHHIMQVSKDNIGVLAMEESIRNTAFNLMSVEADARLYIKEVRNKYTREQLTEWQDKTMGTGRFFAFDHFGSISNDEILSKIRYMAKGLGCKWVILDHLSILVSGQEETDERKSIDILMTKLRSLVEGTNIGLLLVSHLRRPSGDRGHEDGREVSLSHLRGSASIAHLSDSVIALERNQQAADEVEANTTVLRILKNRYTGDTGVCCHLFYDKETGRMTEVNNPFEENQENDTPL
mgnify:FL=1